MDLQITPEPTDDERRAIAAALAAEQADAETDSAWAAELRPRRDDA